MQTYESKEIKIKVNPRPIAKDDVLPVTMRRTAAQDTPDQALWVAIRNRMEAINFKRYAAFINRVFCLKAEGSQAETEVKRLQENITNEFGGKGKKTDNLLDSRLSIHAVDSYNVLKLATEIFLLLESGVVKFDEKKGVSIIELDVLKDSEIIRAEKVNEEEESFGLRKPVTISDIESSLTRYFGDKVTLPYLTRILDALVSKEGKKKEIILPYCEGILKHRANCPSLIELIWNY